MKEIIGIYGEAIKGATAAVAVLTVMAGTLYGVMCQGVEAYVSGLF